MISLMTGFILNGLSECLLSSRLFRIKAWVLQVPFLSMIFLYFFDYSNLNHSKVFYWFLSLLYPYYVLLLCRLLPVQNFYLFLFGLSLYKFAYLFCASLSIFLYKLVPLLHTLSVRTIKYCSTIVSLVPQYVLRSS